MKAMEFAEDTPLESLDFALRVLVIARKELTARNLDDALTGFGSMQHMIRRSDAARPLEQLDDDPAPDVVILEMDGRHDDTLDDVRRFVERRDGRCEVFVTLPEADLPLVKLLVRCGVRDVLSQPLNRQELAIALSGATARQGRAGKAAAVRKGAIVSCLGAGGNMAASSLCVNLACELSGQFRRRCVLVDLDMQFGTVATELDLEPDSGLAEALRHPERLDKVYLDALLVRHSSGLAVLPGPGELGASADIEPQAISRLLAMLAAGFDHVIVNLPAYVDGMVEEVFRHSQPAFVVVQDTLSTLHNLRILLQRLPLRGIPSAQLAVVHYRMDRKLKDVKNADLQKLIGEIPLHVVNSDYRLAARAQNEGKAVSELYPGAPMVRDVRAIAAGLAGVQNTKGKGGGLRLFSLFS